MIRHFAILLVSSLLCGCGSCDPQDPVVPEPPPGPASDPTYCAEACQTWQTLGCEEGNAVYNSDLPPGGAGGATAPNQSCVDWCHELQDRKAAINPKCTRLVVRCDQIEEYRLRNPETDCEK